MISPHRSHPTNNSFRGLSPGVSLSVAILPDDRAVDIPLRPLRTCLPRYGRGGRQGVFVRQGDRPLSRAWEKFENWESMKPETIPMTMAIRALKAALPETERVSVAI